MDRQRASRVMGGCFRSKCFRSAGDHSIVMLRFIFAWHRIRGDQKLYQVFGGMNMEYAALTGQNAVLYTSDQVQQIVSSLIVIHIIFFLHKVVLQVNT